MVDVEHRGLGALEEDVLAGGKFLVQQLGALDDVGAQALGVGQEVLADLLDGVGGQAIDLLEDGVLIGQRDGELLAEGVLVEHVLHAQAGAVHLVHVAGTDAALSGADEVLAEVLLVGAVEVAVVGHDDVRVARDAQALAAEALGLEGVDLLEDDRRVDDAAVADDRQGVLVDNAGGNLVKSQLVAVGDDRVTGVSTAAVAADDIEVTRDEVGDLTLALVAPLGTHKNRC